MLNWVAVVRRMMQLYRVRTLRDLGMAIGVPMRPEDNGPDMPVPWRILELVVAEQRISWDWLLTGRHFRTPGGETVAKSRKGDEDLPQQTAVPSLPPPQPIKPPRIETRELARTFLDRRTGDRYTPPGLEPPPEPESPPEPPPKPDAGAAKDEVVRELEEIRTSIQKELERVETILRERGAGGA